MARSAPRGVSRAPGPRDSHRPRTASACADLSWPASGVRGCSRYGRRRMTMNTSRRERIASSPMVSSDGTLVVAHGASAMAPMSGPHSAPRGVSRADAGARDSHRPRTASGIGIKALCACMRIGRARVRQGGECSLVYVCVCVVSSCGTFACPSVVKHRSVLAHGARASYTIWLMTTLVFPPRHLGPQPTLRCRLRVDSSALARLVGCIDACLRGMALHSPTSSRPAHPQQGHAKHFVGALLLHAALLGTTSDCGAME